jgi:hypothetical protein
MIASFSFHLNFILAIYNRTTDFNGEIYFPQADRWHSLSVREASACAERESSVRQAILCRKSI